jgi:hypothetical protein
LLSDANYRAGISYGEFIDSVTTEMDGRKSGLEPNHVYQQKRSRFGGADWTRLGYVRYGRAIAALMREGFSEFEIDALGVLCCHAPDLTDLLFSMGVEPERAIFYNDCFADGAILLIVCTEPGRRARSAVNIMRQHGGYSRIPIVDQSTSDERIKSCHCNVIVCVLALTLG